MSTTSTFLTTPSVRSTTSGFNGINGHSGSPNSKDSTQVAVIRAQESAASPVGSPNQGSHQVELSNDTLALLSRTLTEKIEANQKENQEIGYTRQPKGGQLRDLEMQIAALRQERDSLAQSKGGQLRSLEMQIAELGTIKNSLAKNMSELYDKQTKIRATLEVQNKELQRINSILATNQVATTALQPNTYSRTQQTIPSSRDPSHPFFVPSSAAPSISRNSTLSLHNSFGDSDSPEKSAARYPKEGMPSTASSSKDTIGSNGLKRKEPPINSESASSILNQGDGTSPSSISSESTKTAQSLASTKRTSQPMPADLPLFFTTFYPAGTRIVYQRKNAMIIDYVPQDKQFVIRLDSNSKELSPKEAPPFLSTLAGELNLKSLSVSSGTKSVSCPTPAETGSSNCSDIRVTLNQIVLLPRDKMECFVRSNEDSQPYFLAKVFNARLNEESGLVCNIRLQTGSRKREFIPMIINSLTAIIPKDDPRALDSSGFFIRELYSSNKIDDNFLHGFKLKEEIRSALSQL